MAPAEQFTLSGATSQPVLADALVELRVGSALFTTVADASGRFTVQAQCDESPDDLVYVIVRGVGAQSELHLARVLDGCGTVQATAGESGIYRTGPINPVSTGMYAAMRWLAERDAEYEWPMRASELTQVRYRLGGNRVVTAAQAIAYWKAGLGSPPSGIDNTLDLVLDRFALSEYVALIKLDESHELQNEFARQVLWGPAHFRRPAEIQSATKLATVCAELQQVCGELFGFNPDASLLFVNRFDASSGQWLDLARQDQIFADALERRFSTLRTLEATPDGDSFLWSQERFVVLDDPDLGTIKALRRNAATRAAVRFC